MYYFVPQMIKYYLDQEPILPNVPTYLASEEADRKYILDNLETRREGGQRIRRLRHVDRAEGDEGGNRRVPRKSRGRAAQLHRAADDFAVAPSDVCATACSKAGTLICGRIILSGEKTVIVPGGLTRVALRKGSLVVNSSQGGGSKDTWVLYGDE